MKSVVERLDRYQVLGHLATGGMAEILLARVGGPSGFERPVVLKRILPHLARETGFVTMFLDEARLVAQIRHHNVIQVQELVHAGGELFFVMEYLEGESVAGLMRRLELRGTTIDPVLGAHILAESCAGLHAAHELTDLDGKQQEIVHRDISPQNLFVTYSGQIKVLDFGIAKAQGRDTRTEAGQVKGKFAYMSPEQCRSEPLDRRCDVFALGIVLYELTTGRRLFKRDSPLGVITAICKEPIVPPSRIVADYPPALEAVCLRALAARREDRYETAAEMRRDLLAYQRSAAGADSPTEALALVMQTVFFDRIAEKQDLLRKMRAGSDVTHVPVGEVDENVELPSVVAETRRDAPATGAWPRARSPFRRALVVVFAISGATLGGALAFAWRSPSDTAAPRASSTASAALPLAATPSSAPSATPAPAEITLHVETQPAGAHVLLDSVDQGATPLDVKVPRGRSALPLELRRAGYLPLVQPIVPDADQRLVLSLHPRPGAAVSAPPSATADKWKKWN
jgi:eukaryotic-like serine/threonine-protein kinase